MLNMKEHWVDFPRIKKPSPNAWIPSYLDDLKFNVDGSTRGKPGPTGISGVLKNSKGKIMCLFSLFIGIQDSNTAEIMAIHKACMLFASNPSIAGHNIIIVNDSSTAVSWANNTEGSRSWALLVSGTD
ncbi:hypothetical protein Dsin_009607 [Dipteronia sinensis]|uniref:RNase H type-1 domain-containing protein n=1 Tax=Dipteronia sinensis TaxID=43782 RepID=A0AAE0AS59_9ROSI|nr:hypothetical protein Dsin_009607 [Dipteronia sinensis]